MTELPAETAAVAAETLPAPTEQRPGVPVWRVGKPDAFLAEAVEEAREAVRSIATDEHIGRHLGARSEGVRCVTHLFTSNLPGYVGWTWFATVTRVSRSKDVTVNEVGMLPTNGAILAPPWVPWSDRVRPEDEQPPEPVAVQEADDDESPAPEGDAPEAEQTDEDASSED